jgi:XRE family transcriptional regulator, regulator of sulfur utilization
MDATDLNQRLGRRVRARRVARGDSLGDVARASGLSKTILSRIESGEGNPSVETLWRLSQALEVPLGTLLEGGEEAPRTRRIARGSGAALSADSGMASWMVHADGRGGRTELHELSLPAGVEHRSGAHLPGTEEVILCLSGRLEAGLDGAAEPLGPGDAVWFVADGPHAYRALGDTEARALCWMLYAGGAA